MNIKLIQNITEEDFLNNWGTISRICYATSPEKAKGIAKHCMSAGHFSGSRSQFFVFEIEGVSRAMADQLARHSVGTMINMQSQRYVSGANFDYYTPPKIANDPIKKLIYDEAMENAKESYQKLIGLFEADDIKGEKANENARGVLPMNTHTKLCVGFTIEALIHFFNMRLCVRAQDEIRQLANMMRDLFKDTHPYLIQYFVPQCDNLLYCPEKQKGCRHPSKVAVKKLLAQYKYNAELKEWELKIS